jgi:hypothetical protein
MSCNTTEPQCVDRHFNNTFHSYLKKKLLQCKIDKSGICYIRLPYQELTHDLFSSYNKTNEMHYFSTLFGK